MNKRIKKLWVAALRSGNYKQGQGCLRSPKNEFCCLGVLCNLHAIEHPSVAAKQTDPLAYLANHDMPPVEVREWAEIGWNSHLSIGSLAGRNDNGDSFASIAVAIERYL